MQPDISLHYDITDIRLMHRAVCILIKLSPIRPNRVLFMAHLVAVLDTRIRPSRSVKLVVWFNWSGSVSWCLVEG